MDHYFEHLPAYGIVRCRQCRYAVAPQHIPSHLREQHRHIPSAARKAIADEALRCSAASAPDEVRHPPHGAEPVPGFPVICDALQCGASDDAGACEYICRSLRGMQRHCERRHAWINSQTRGGNKMAQHQHAPDAPWSRGVSCQSFFREPKWRRFFRVEAADQRAEETEAIDKKRSFFDRQSCRFAPAAARVEGGDTHKSAVASWLQTLGIAKHLRDLQLDQIKQAVAPPDRRLEPALYAAANAFDSLVRRAYASCLDDAGGHMSQPVQLALARFHSGPEPTGRARMFRFRKQAGTLDDYISTGRRLIGYLSRVGFAEEYHFDCEARKGSLPEDAITPDDEHEACWDEAMAQARATHSDALEPALLALWMSLLKHDLGPRPYKSPLVSFCAMLAIKTNTGAWHEPGNFNKHLSAMVWLTQLLLFHDCARRADLEGSSALRLVREGVDAWMSREAETPMGELLGWRLLLFGVSRNTVASSEAYWDEAGEVVTYNGVELPLSCVPTLLASEHAHAYRRLYEDLLLSQPVRRLRSSRLHDNAAVEVAGWHLALSPENAEQLEGCGDALLRAIRDTDSLGARYLQPPADDDADYSWRPGALASYEEAVQAFLAHLCVLVHIASGQPLREPELLSATWRNTQHRRSISVCLGRVMIHTKYDKTRNISGLDRDNIRFLPRALGDMLLDFLIYAQPLRQVFLQQSNPDALLSPYLWQKGGEVWRDSRVGQCLRKACANAGAPSLSVSVWRQMTVAIVKTKFAADIAYFVDDERDADGEEMDEDIRAMNAQRNHRTRTANRAYANQAGAAYGGAWDGLIRRGLRASQMWQDYFGVDVVLKATKRPASPAGGRLAKLQAAGIHRPRRRWAAEDLLQEMRRLHRDNAMDWRSPEQREAMVAVAGAAEQVVAVLPTGAGKSMLFLLPCVLPGAACTLLLVPLVALRGDLLRRIEALGIPAIEWRMGERREAALVIASVEAAATADFLEYAQQLAARHRLDRIVLDECHLTVTAEDYRRSFAALAEVRVVRTQFVYLSATLPPSIWDAFLDRNHLQDPLVVRASANRPNIAYSVERAPPRTDFLQQVADRALAIRERIPSPGKLVVYAATVAGAQRLAGLLGCDAYTSHSGTAEEKSALLSRWVSSEQPFIAATTALAEGFDHPLIRAVLNAGAPDSLAQLAQQSGRAGRDGAAAQSIVIVPAGWKGLPAPSCDAPLGSLAADRTLRKQHDTAAVRSYVQLGRCLRLTLSECLDLPQHLRACTPPDLPCQVCVEGPLLPVASPMKPAAISTPARPVASPIEPAAISTPARPSAIFTLAKPAAAAMPATPTSISTPAAVPSTYPPIDTTAASFAHPRADNTTPAATPSTHPIGLKSLQLSKSKEASELEDYVERLSAARGTCLLCRARGEDSGHQLEKCRVRFPFFDARKAAVERNKRRGWMAAYTACFTCLNPQAICPGALKGSKCEFKDTVLPICWGAYVADGAAQWFRERFGREFSDEDAYMDWIGEETRFGGERAVQGVRVAALALAERPA